MATYDPQKGHARPKPAVDEPVPVDELLDVATDQDDTSDTSDPPTSDMAPAPSPVPPSAAGPAPSAPSASSRGGPAKKVGIGVAITAVLFALRWALKRKKRSRAE